MTEATRCPGNELNKNLQVYNVKCAKCGADNEIFADELNKKHKCTKCGADLDTSNLGK